MINKMGNMAAKTVTLNIVVATMAAIAAVRKSGSDLLLKFGIGEVI